MRWAWMILGVLCVTLAVVAATLPFVLGGAPALEKFSTVPAFSLTDSFGEPFSSDDVKGKVWIADFMFTSCPTICPVLSSHIALVQSQLKMMGLDDEVEIVSFSVDPETDTPEVLRQYGERFKAEPGLWHMLTGQRAAIWALCKDGFLLHVAESDANPAEPITHAGKFVLVDGDGVIRGYYDGESSAVVEQITADASRLVKAQ